jgi:hypothetical protein
MKLVVNTCRDVFILICRLGVTAFSGIVYFLDEFVAIHVPNIWRHTTLEEVCDGDEKGIVCHKAQCVVTFPIFSWSVQPEPIFTSFDKLQARHMAIGTSTVGEYHMTTDTREGRLKALEAGESLPLSFDQDLASRIHVHVCFEPFIKARQLFAR